jgi:hypothetical protein
MNIMSDNMIASRRRLLKASFASLAACAIGLPTCGLTAAMAPGSLVTNTPLAIAKAELARMGARIAKRDVVGVADFGLPSSRPRFHLIDLASGRVTEFLVAHGKGSDPGHTGWLTAFSNTPGSDATSRGAFLTGEYYEGEHGRSMRLDGLDPTNSNARERGIVVHSAWYVGPRVVQSHGMVGRSEGCFAVSTTDLSEVLTRLGPGRLLVATKT